MQQPNFKKSQMEALYISYMDNSGSDGEEINQCHRRIYQQLKSFPYPIRNRVECLITELCAVQERIAFLDGVRTGAKLIMELTK